MTKFLFERRSDRGTTVIVVGGLGGESGPFAPGLRAGLWIASGPDFARLPAEQRPADLRLVDVAMAPPTEISAAIEDLVRKDAKSLPSLYVTEGTLTAHPDAYQQAVRQMYERVEGHLRARHTRQSDGFAWQRHVLANLRGYLDRRVPLSWQGALVGLPAFICGAGPSLDASAPRLRAVADRGIVFAADSALKALAALGVAADFAVSIDVAKVPEKCLPEACPPVRVILSGVSPPSWTTDPTVNQPFFLSNRQITLDWLEQKGVARTAVRATESCGSTALELAHFMGCSPIFLFGMDLALDPKAGARHSSASDPSLYTASGFNGDRALPKVPGNYGDVSTHIYGDLKALNDRLAEWPAGLVHNVNDRGAALANTTLVSPEGFYLPETTVSKSHRLAALGGPMETDPATRRVIAATVAALGRQGVAAMPRLRSALQQGGIAALWPLLQPLFADREFAQCLGAFSLKCMPHLMPPVLDDRAFWTGILDEMAVLVTAAAAIDR